MHEDADIREFGWTIEQRVSPDTQLRQGDLIAFQSDDKLRQFGLVVTADCDLTQRKHARLVTLVPVVELCDVVECYLLPELCERQRLQIAGFVGKAFGVSVTEALPEDLEDLRGRIERASADPRLAVACLAARVLMHDVERLSAGDYKKISHALGQKPGQLEKRLEQQVKAKGDLLVLPPLVSLKIAADIAWVRHVWQVPLKDIVFRTSQLGPNKGQRVARLDSPFRYRLTQLMAQVFADIGLPDVPREVEKEISEILAEGA
jgi:hypothetical protein